MGSLQLPTLALEPHWMRDFFHASLALKEEMDATLKAFLYSLTN